MSTIEPSPPRAETHKLTCVADCGAVPTASIETVWIYPVLGVVLALAWIGVRRLIRRRRSPPGT